jgi:hypothetical protein
MAELKKIVEEFNLLKTRKYEEFKENYSEKIKHSLRREIFLIKALGFLCDVATKAEIQSFIDILMKLNPEYEILDEIFNNKNDLYLK